MLSFAINGMNEKLNELYEDHGNYLLLRVTNFGPISNVFVIFHPKSKYASCGLCFLYVFNTFSLFLSSLADKNASTNTTSIK